MKILALDLGKFKTMCCFFDTKTRKYSFLLAATERNYLKTVFEKHTIDLVVMEACGPSGWISDLANQCGHKTLVCSTNEEAWRWSNVKRKTDKDDALKLARMAAMRELKPVHMPSHQHREFRSLVKYRKVLDNRINRMKNTIRSFFVNQGIEIDKGDKAWHTGRERINSFRKPLGECSPDELWKGELDLELTQLDATTEHLTEVTKRLDVIGKHDPRIQRVQTIPGVGPRTAEILVACLDDPHRFKNGREVSAYFGLVPRKYQSGETDRNGRITKRGNPLARTILVECSWASRRYNPWAKAVYERIAGGQRRRKKKAAIALARKLAVIAWALLRDEKDWDPQAMIRVTESFGPMNAKLKETLDTMKPKENADQRKKRLRREAREARNRQAAEATCTRPSGGLKTKAKSRKATKTVEAKAKRQSSPLAKPKPGRPKTDRSSRRKAKSASSKPTSAKTRRARKPVPAG